MLWHFLRDGMSIIPFRFLIPRLTVVMEWVFITGRSTTKSAFRMSLLNFTSTPSPRSTFLKGRCQILIGFTPYRFFKAPYPRDSNACAWVAMSLGSLNTVPSLMEMSSIPRSLRSTTMSSTTREVVMTPYLGKFTALVQKTILGLINTLALAGR